MDSSVVTGEDGHQTRPRTIGPDGNQLDRLGAAVGLATVESCTGDMALHVLLCQAADPESSCEAEPLARTRVVLQAGRAWHLGAFMLAAAVYPGIIIVHIGMPMALLGSA